MSTPNAVRGMSFITTLFVLLAGVIFYGPSAVAQDEIAGTWDGAIEIPGTKLEITVEFIPGETGDYTATIDIPVQGIQGMALTDVEINLPDVSFAIPGIPGEPKFAGTLSADGPEISGQFIQGGQTFPFSLIQKSEAELAEEKAARQAKLDDLREFIDTTMAVWNVPGLAMAIVEDGEVILAEGFGWRDIEDSLPVTEHTVMAIGSSSKAFTTMAMGMLVYEGLLDWDEPVRTYLPTFELDDDFATARMTPRDLVTHRSGLPRHDLMWYDSPLTRRELFDRLKHLEPNEDFRTTFQYQNLMFMTAGYLVGQITGGTWEEAVQEYIFDQLVMDNSNFSVIESQTEPDYALPYKEENDTIKVMPFRNIDAMGPAGSINSSVTDMAKWVQLHLNGGKVGETELVSAALVSEMHTPQMVINQPTEYTERLNSSYGLGWFVEVYRGHNRVHHGGNIDGFSALVSLLPRDGLGMVVLTNMNGTPLPGIVSLYATDLLLDLEPVDFHGRIKARVDAGKAALEENKEEKAEMDRVEGTKPAHKLSEYAGEYEHPAYGTANITLDGKKLKLEYNAFAGELAHWHYEVFKAELTEFGGQKIALHFLTNSDGLVDRISVPLEALVDEIVFKRLPPAYLSDPDYLARFVGEFEVAGMTIRFEIKGGSTLVLIIPGSKPTDLEPYRDAEYKMKGLTGYSIKFIIGKDNVVNEALLKQPDGAYTATRKTE